MITKLGLDQTRFIVRLLGVNPQTLVDQNIVAAMNYKAIWEHVHSCTAQLKPGSKHWDLKKGAMTKSVYPLDNGSMLTVALGWSSKAEYHFMTVQFNPSKLTAMAAMELEAAFQCMFDLGYTEFFQRSDCSYIEIPLDVFGAKMTDYLFFDTRLKTVNDYHEADGTLYLGSRTSSRYTTVYDKAKEIADKGGPAVQYHWLRVEPHLHPNTPATKMAALPNAYVTLCIIDKQKLTAIKRNDEVKDFGKRVFLSMECNRRRPI